MDPSLALGAASRATAAVPQEKPDVMINRQE